MTPDTVLANALARTPRPYRLPPLPASVAQAQAEGIAASLAFAIEAVRRHAMRGGPAPGPGIAALFLRQLAALVEQALEGDAPEPAFQAQVLQSQEPLVDEYVRLSAQAAADRRTVRSAVDAFAHPGKLGAAEADGVLAPLHALARDARWSELRVALARVVSAAPGPAVAAAAQAALASLALARLQRIELLAGSEPVRIYLVLHEQMGPVAGSDAAAAQGRAAARTGEAAERATVQALAAIAHAFNAVEPGWRAVGNLRTPAGFPGEASRTKDEWDAALVRDTPGGEADIVLLAEVKAAPSAATNDYMRLRRGLERLAGADPQLAYRFAIGGGAITLTGASLQALGPTGPRLPANVIYCCEAPAEPDPPWLSAASRAVLLAEPACVAFARRLAQGEHPASDSLAPVWEALPTEPRLRAALNQYDTTQAARGAMLRPQDLREAVLRGLAQGATR